MAGIWLILAQIFGPLLAELLQKLLDKWFAKAAKKMPVGATFDAQDQQVALIDKTLEILPWWRWGLRATLQDIRVAVVRGGPATADEVARMVAAAGAAEDE